MAGTHVVVLKGVFYADPEKGLSVSEESQGTVSIRDILSTLVGTKVIFFACHKPVEPPCEEKWGGGCCFYEGLGRCPAGHHERPKWLFQIHRTGNLTAIEDGWGTEIDGSVTDLHLGFLEGHRSMIVATSLPSIEGLKEEFEVQDPTDVDELTAKLERLRNLMSQVAGKDDE